jgi:hypothetical protein
MIVPAKSLLVGSWTLEGSGLEDVFSAVAIERLKSYIGEPQLVDRFAEIAKRDDPVMRVLVAGHRRAGKGALLNALTDASGTGSFRDSGKDDDVLTMEIRGVSYTSYHIPENGLARLPDEIAELAAGANHVMLVHDPGIGQLKRSEVDFLELLHEQGSDNLRSRLSVVLSHREAYETIIQELLGFILGQSKDVLGFEPEVFMVSYARYLKGVLLDKPAFTERSGIPELQQRLSGLLDDINLRAAQSIGDSADDTVRLLLDAIDRALVERETEMRQIETHLDDIWSALVDDMDRLAGKYEERLAAYEAAK